MSRRGNVGLAGHHDTFFRPLRKIRLGDAIVLTNGRRDFLYRVVSTRIVDPAAIEVLQPTEKEVLTLVTCYPFYDVGAARKRFIVRAQAIRKIDPIAPEARPVPEQVETPPQFR